MALSAKRYFQVSFFAPIFIPILLSPFYGSKSFLGGLSAMAVISLLFGGIPYLLMLVLLFFIWRHLDYRQLQILTLFIPFLFIGVLTICYFVLGMFHPNKADKFLSIIPIFWIVSLILGYAYVLMVNLIYYILKSGGAIQTESIQNDR